MSCPLRDLQRARARAQLQAHERTTAVIWTRCAEPLRLALDCEALEHGFPDAVAPVVELRTRPVLARLTGKEEVLAPDRRRFAFAPRVDVFGERFDERDGALAAGLGRPFLSITHGLVDRDRALADVAVREG